MRARRSEEDTAIWQAVRDDLADNRTRYLPHSKREPQPLTHETTYNMVIYTYDELMMNQLLLLYSMLECHMNNCRLLQPEGGDLKMIEQTPFTVEEVEQENKYTLDRPTRRRHG